jgi:hypothetical protein
MEKYKFEYNFPDHIKGDTFEGVKFVMTDVQIAGAGIDLSGASVTMELRQLLKDGTLSKTFTSDSGGGLSITSSSSEQSITFDQQVVDVTALLHHYSIKITFSGGDIKTYIGGTWNIKANPTQA